jgi:hypothetical protein
VNLSQVQTSGSFPLQKTPPTIRAENFQTIRFVESDFGPLSVEHFVEPVVAQSAIVNVNHSVAAQLFRVITGGGGWFFFLSDDTLQKIANFA